MLAVAILLGIFAVALSVVTLVLTRSHQRAATLRLDAITRRLESLAESRTPSHPSVAAAPSAPEPVLGKSRPSLRADRPEPPPAATLIAVPNLAITEGEPPELVAAELGRRYAALWDLAEAGASSESIAKTTGQPIGEVELILGLKRQTHHATATLRS
jgi:hypothetical protein